MLLEYYVTYSLFFLIKKKLISNYLIKHITNCYILMKMKFFYLILPQFMNNSLLIFMTINEVPLLAIAKIIKLHSVLDKSKMYFFKKLLFIFINVM